jgi:hypothetical protein
MNLGEKIAEIEESGFCVLRARFPPPLIEACREAFWPTLLDYLNEHRESPNRGPHRHFLPMPFQPPCFRPEFFFDPGLLNIVRAAMGEKVVADQWGCDVSLRGSQPQGPHVDYQRPLFAEVPNLLLPPYMLVVSFGLSCITQASGTIQIAPGTHLMEREEAVRATRSGEID